MTRRALKARLKLIERSLDLLHRKDELLRRSCMELGEELFAALERCSSRPEREKGEHEAGCPRLQFWDAGEWEAPCFCVGPDCDCEACQKARLCIEVNARAYEEILLEEQRLMEASGLVKPAPAVEERH